ncbi:MAG: type I glyceraldehyde-3-phosphate dehydrogenase [Chloroflexi bacterium]|nr:MAG: type I glyceraldehyde-3-phosphate dehydrogenase [Chloroflexota bacterium]MBL1197441.1 type I glyceraldehyde-3-phosphate dehydrogenase [Chloroflexota bacterium]NOH14736.1 type I glyceraldehyde-3-phosphate dehydrogenase [Chloroflexota bacterium]
MAKVAINGLGRIGRATLRVVLTKPELELVAINDIAPLDNLAYLVKYDTVYGRYGEDIRAEGSNLIVDGKTIPFYSERNPEDLPWGKLGVDIVFEATGVFTDREGAEKHVKAGAKYAIISAPTKSEDVPTVVHGVNTSDGEQRIISCASCTTNSITPVVEIIGRHFGIQKAIMTTIHGYTASQSIVDGPHKKWRRGRAGAANLVPTSTGAAIATTKALPQYEGKFNGVAVRAPVPVGSVSDLTFVTEKDTTVEAINDVFRKEAQTEQYQEVMSVAEDPIVSSDIIGDPHAAIIDLGMTTVVDGNLVKVMSWYDNEWGYTNQMVREAIQIASTL